MQHIDQWDAEDSGRRSTWARAFTAARELASFDSVWQPAHLHKCPSLCDLRAGKSAAVSATLAAALEVTPCL